MLWLIGVVAGAAPTPESVAGPRFEWNAPPECPSKASIVRRVDALQGRPQGTTTSTGIRFVARKEGEEAWVLVVEEEGIDARELPARSCEELADAAALLVSVALSVEGNLGSADALVPLPAPPSPTVAEPAPAKGELRAAIATTATEEGPRPRKRSLPGAAVHAGGGLGLGFAGRPSGVVTLGVGLRGSVWSVDVGGFAAPRTRLRPDVPAITADVSVIAAGVTGCGVAGGGRLEFPFCVVGLAGIATAKGAGALRPHRATHAWGALAPTGGLRISVTPRLWITASGGPLFVLNRPRFRIDGVGVVCCTQTAGAIFEGGLELRFPILARAR